MGYQTDLDEYTETELLDELVSRAAAREAGKCDYCGRPRCVPPSCRFPERHGPVPDLGAERTPATPGEGTWAVFAEKVVAERDAALAELAALRSGTGYSWPKRKGE
jgi:hypothetical protein